MRRRKNVSLSLELHLVSRALDGMRLMTEKWKELHFTEEELPRLAHALHATLVIVRERMMLLDRGVRDTLDPRHLFCNENEAFEAQPGDDADVVLRAWSTKKTAEKLRKDAEQAERRLQVLRERRQTKESVR
jgi:hypothetical protein